MKPVPLACVVALVLAGCRSGTVAPEPAAVAALRAADRFAARDLWPGFDAGAVPVALYDGARTWLYRHPAPPAAYTPHPALPRLFVRDGRDSLVWANSSVELGGVRTATVMPPGDASAGEAAGTVIHESFHVFQLARHPAWGANEVHLFTYPAADARALALRRVEYAELRAALAAPRARIAACWGAAAMAARRERFALLPADARAYERGSELREGLANYVEHRARGFPDDEGDVPAGEFAPEAVRQRGYATGLLMGRLLDRVNPAWRQALELTDSLLLDSLLSLSLEAQGAAPCTLPDSVRRVIASRAEDDVAVLRNDRVQVRRRFLEQPGWRLTIVAAGPLWPQGFDPLNVQVLGGGEVLHVRYVRLGNDAGAIEVLGRPSLTTAAGAHPLFNGVREIAITGFAAEPAVTADSGAVRIAAPGVTARFRGANVERQGQAVVIRLGS